MLRRIYTFLLYWLTPFIVFRLYWKSRRLPAYRERISERFSWGKVVPIEVDVWLHAVSLGEVVAATPLIDALLLKKVRVLITTMTPTGSEQVLRRFGQTVAHQYVPYDLPWALRRFFKKINARVGVIMETELWPNLINQASKAQLPLLLVNARISDKGFESYLRLRVFFKPILAQFKMILAQSKLDANRFIELGAPINTVSVLGNLKFDLQLNVAKNAFPYYLKERWGSARPVLIAASTHDDEENQVLAAVIKLKTVIPDLLLLIAPRHPERFKMVYALSQKHGYKTGLRSAPESVEMDSEVIVLDSLGELLDFYQVSDYAFVGGSLVPVGGHNVLEPIAVQVPVFCGPYMQNSKSICFDLSAAGALQQVKDIDGLITAVVEMHNSLAIRTEQVSRASGVLESNRGSVLKCLEAILEIMSHDC